MNSIRVVLADDHSLVRAGISSLLTSLPKIDVVGEAKDGRELMRLIRDRSPNLALLDISMSGMNGLKTLTKIVRDHPDVKVIMLSMHDNEEYVLQSLRFGASGYLLKDSARSELELAVRSAMRGEKYLSES